MSSYFASFPIATAANTRIFKYVGGDLGAGNPLQIFSPASERLDRTKAYWFSADVVGNFYAPLEVSLSTEEGLTFGRSGSIVSAYPEPDLRADERDVFSCQQRGRTARPAGNHRSGTAHAP